MQKGAVIWICGLAGAGKTTIGAALYEAIKVNFDKIIFLDGDILKEIIGHLGYSREERIVGARRISNLCAFLSNNGINVICSTISLFEDIYKLNREKNEKYFEIFVECPMEELIKRDQKNIYSSYLKGKAKDIVGMDIDYDIPSPDLIINNTNRDQLNEKIKIIVKALREKNFLPNGEL